MNLHKGIIHCKANKLTVNVYDDFILKEVLFMYKTITFKSAVKDIFNVITYQFYNKKDYQTFLEFMEITVNCHNLKIKMKAGYYDETFKWCKKMRKEESELKLRRRN